MNANGSVEGQAKALPVPASKVGNNFVNTYYQFLLHNPESVHNFYDSDASFAHLVKGQKSSEVNNVRGNLNIAEAIKKLSYPGKKIDVESVDCQESVNGSVLVVVTGSFYKDGSTYRRGFTQTFVLAAKVSQQYFVHNDVLRFLDDEEVAPKAKASKSSSKEAKAARAAKAEDKKKEPEAKKKEPAAAKSSPAAAPAAKPEVAAAPLKADKKPERKEKQKRAKKESKQAPPAAAAAAPSSWAARLGHKAPAPAASAPAAAAPVAEQTPASNEGKPSGGKTAKSEAKATNTSASSASSQQSEARGDGFKEVSRTKRTTNKRDTKKHDGDDDITAQIYVNNLPAGTSKAEVESAFKKFGAIKEIQMPNNKEKTYCFVHFAAAGGVDAVLANKPVKMGENELQIDRRRRRWADRSDRDGSSRRGRFPRRGGRGGGNRGRRGGEGRSEGSA